MGRLGAASYAASVAASHPVRPSTRACLISGPASQAARAFTSTPAARTMAGTLAVFMERMARQQIDAQRVGGSKAIDTDEARRARDFLRTDRIMNLTFDAWTRRAQRRRGGVPE